MTEVPQAPGAGVRLLNGRYRLGAVLGYGGMAEVYRARDVRLDRDVAVKVLRSDLARDATFQARFRREAQSAAALNHPMIVAVYDTGEDDRHSPPLPYIVMEYVPGQTLREVLQTGGRLTPARALEIVMGVCDALAYSHRSGIVHRDIKPGNVMVTPDGSIKVMDFGIARAVAQSTSTVTQTAAVMGTAQYLSPEQARGDAVDARSDLYSAGVVLYELVTGRPPFQGDSAVAVAYQHVREAAIPPTDVEPALADGQDTGGPAEPNPDDLDAVVMKTLAKNPANRYQSAGELRDDLGRLLTGRKVLATPLLRDHTPPPRPATRRPPTVRRRRRRNRLLAALLLLLAVVAVIGGLLLARTGSSDERVAVPPVRGLTIEAATKLVQENGLRAEPVAVRNPLPPGTVLSSDPQVGTKVAKKTPVKLVYSNGPGVQTIPPGLEGMTPDDAVAALRQLGFSTRKELVQAPATPVGRVAGTQPSSGTNADPQAVTVVIQVANDQTTVPQLQGLSQDVARTQLSSADLQINEVTSPSTLPSGQVLLQDVAPGTVVGRGTTVTITVSQQVTPTPTPKPKPTHKPKPTPSPSSSPSPPPTTPPSPPTQPGMTVTPVR